LEKLPVSEVFNNIAMGFAEKCFASKFKCWELFDASSIVPP
jgi:hypothetical protein